MTRLIPVLAAALTVPAIAFAQQGGLTVYGIVDASAAVDAAGAAPSLVTTIVEVEPNNSTAAPQVLQGAPLLVNGSIASSSDMDYYKFSLPGSKRLTVTLTPNVSSNYDLYVYNLAGRLLGSSRNGAGVKDTVVINNITGGSNTLSIRVVYTSGLTGTSGTYGLSLSY